MSVPAERDTPRAMCYTCFKPQVVCICRTIRRVENRTGITIIQHPREQRHPIGTARIAELCLANVHRAVDLAGRLRGAARLSHLPVDAGLLYPGEQARDLAELAPHQRPSHLVVLDGTWHHAHTLYRDIVWLRELPQYRLTPSAPGNYRIRREPHPSCLSTVESIVAALQAIEPELDGIDALLDAFDAMITAQIEFVGKGSNPRRKSRAPRTNRAVPRALIDDADSLVLVYGETATTAAAGDALVYWAALRLATGEAFERVIAAPGALPSSHKLECMGLGSEDLAAAVPTPTFRQQWRAFTRPSDRHTAWNQSTLAFLEPAPGKRHPIMLKAAYSNLRRARGTLDEIVAAERLRVAAAEFRGRAGLRMANGVAMIEFLQNHVDGYGAGERDSDSHADMDSDRDER